MNKKVIILIVLALVIIAVYFLVKNNKIMKPIRLLKYFMLSEFDTGATTEEMGAKPTYTNSMGQVRVKNSGEKNMDKQFLNMLDSARGIIEKGWNKENPTKKIAFVITSGYRSPQFNSTLSGSVSNSAHTYGMAVDIAWSNYSTAQKEAILSALYEVGFRRFGTANSFVHVDSSDASNGHPTPASWGYPTSKYSISEIANL